MSDELPFEPSPVGEDEVGVEKSLRPSRLEEFIGQRRVVDNLRIAIETARERGDVLDHILFSGMPGLGKTTLSFLIAHAMGVEMHQTSGPALERGKDIVGILTRMARGDVFFIDEIHRISREVEEYLYSAMEDYCVDIVIDPGADARVLRIPVQPFTLVGATTREGLLSAPFRGRFGIVEKLEPYPDPELTQIVTRSARLLSCHIEAEPARRLARSSRGTPRYANRFLRRIRDVAQYRALQERAGRDDGAASGPAARTGDEPGADGHLTLTMEAIDEGLERLGVDEHGLDRVDRRILEVLLASDEPVGVKTLAVSIGEEERTIEDVYEPYLIQKGMLFKTSRGRRATPRAIELYDRRPGGPRQGEFSFGTS